MPLEAPPVTKKMDGKPVVARRIIGPNDSQSTETKSGS
jgi:hypothetical protein